MLHFEIFARIWLAAHCFLECGSFHGVFVPRYFYKPVPLLAHFLRCPSSQSASLFTYDPLICVAPASFPPPVFNSQFKDSPLYKFAYLLLRCCASNFFSVPPQPKNLDAQLQRARVHPEKTAKVSTRQKRESEIDSFKYCFWLDLSKTCQPRQHLPSPHPPVKTLPIFNSAPGFAVWINLVTLYVERLASNRSTFVLGSFEGAAAFVKIRICRLGNVNPFLYVVQINLLLFEEQNRHKFHWLALKIST